MEMKTIHSLLIVFALFALAACGGKDEASTEDTIPVKDETNTEETTPPTQVETPTEVETPIQEETSDKEAASDEAEKNKKFNELNLHSQQLAEEIEGLKNEIQAIQDRINTLTDTGTQTSGQSQSTNAESEAQISQLNEEKAELEAHRDDFIFIEDFELVWKDRGSGANDDVSFFHPKPPSGYVILGDYVQGNYNNPEGKVLVARQNENVKKAEGHDPIWDDKGSGADDDFSSWRPKAPQGYKCLGNITVARHGQPNKEIWCVKDDMVEETSLGNKVWDDRGSAADKDFSAWHIPATGLFAAHASHAKPTGSFYTIKQEYTQEGIDKKIAQNALALNLLTTEVADLNAQMLAQTRKLEEKEQELADTQQKIDILTDQ